MSRKPAGYKGVNADQGTIQAPKGKPIMQPDAPWKATPLISKTPTSMATGGVYTAKEAFAGNDPSKYRDPQIDNSVESAVGGFLDTGLLMRQTKEFPIKWADPKAGPPEDSSNDVGGFPNTAMAGGGYGPILNVGGMPRFPQRFSAEEARSNAVAGGSAGAELSGGKKIAAKGATITTKKGK